MLIWTILNEPIQGKKPTKSKIILSLFKLSKRANNNRNNNKSDWGINIKLNKS